ncbi:MAG: DUF4783 domain-containing protein [Bacteroidales bacterium]|nr:DUF4783 domain-containing protein [Bacteroidales bacterium]
MSSILVLNTGNCLCQGNIPEGILTSIKSGNASSLCKYFNPKIELTINEMEDIYSKEQAELILKDFLQNMCQTVSVFCTTGGKTDHAMLLEVYVLQKRNLE